MVPRRERMESLDALRGAGALLVVLHHAALAFFPHAVLGSSQRQNAAWEDWCHVVPGSLLVAGPFAVQVFFVLSGFVLSRRFFGEGARGNDELAAAAVKRCFRLWPMVVVAILLVVACARLGWVQSAATAEATGSTIWLTQRPHGALDAVSVAKAVIGNAFSRGEPYNSPMWTIESEVWGSFLVFALVFVSRRSPWRWAIYAATAVWLRSASTVPFIAGLALADAHATWDGFRTWATRGWVAWPAGVAALYLGSFPLPLDDAARRHWSAWTPGLWHLKGGTLMLGAVLLVALVLGNARLRGGLECAPGRYFGRISFALYATHEAVLITLGCAVYLAMAGRWGHGPAAFAAGSATIGVSVALAELGTRWVDVPSQRLSDWIGRFYLRTLASNTRDRRE